MFDLRLLKNAHLRRFPRLPAGRLILPRVKHGAACCGVPLQVRIVCQFWGLRISGALHLGIFEQPKKNYFFII
jgi:hypothetical protein